MLKPWTPIIINKLIIFEKDSVYEGSILVIGQVLRMARHLHSTGQFDMDGSHFKKAKSHPKLSGFLKNFIYSDGNNHLHPVALAHHANEECEDNWSQFLSFVWSQLFPENSPTSSSSSSGLDSVVLSSPASGDSLSNEDF